MLTVEQEEAVAVEARGDPGDPLLEGRGIDEAASGRPDVGGHACRKQAFLVPHQGLRRDRFAVELVLDALKLEIADEDPGQRPGQEEARGNDASRRREQTESEVQLSASSRR